MRFLVALALAAALTSPLAAADQPATPAAAPAANLTVNVPAIDCEGCAGKVKAAVADLPGVQILTVDVASKNVAIALDEKQCSKEKLLAALEKGGMAGTVVVKP